MHSKIILYQYKITVMLRSYDINLNKNVIKIDDLKINPSIFYQFNF